MLARLARCPLVMFHFRLALGEMSFAVQRPPFELASCELSLSFTSSTLPSSLLPLISSTRKFFSSIVPRTDEGKPEEWSNFPLARFPTGFFYTRSSANWQRQTLLDHTPGRTRQAAVSADVVDSLARCDLLGDRQSIPYEGIGLHGVPFLHIHSMRLRIDHFPRYATHSSLPGGVVSSSIILPPPSSLFPTAASIIGSITHWRCVGGAYRVHSLR